MPPVRIDLHVDEPFQGAVAEATLKQVAELTLVRELRSGPTCATVTITDDETLRRLNRDYRGEDTVTDVLSFGSSANAHNGEIAGDGFPDAPGAAPTLGDVIIAFPQARRQAEAAGHPVERELALLTAHGILHLLGFDHTEIEDERVMFGKQDAILGEVLGPPDGTRTRS